MERNKAEIISDTLHQIADIILVSVLEDNKDVVAVRQLWDRISIYMEGMLGISAEDFAGGKNKMRKVINVDTGEVYNSLTEAATSIGFTAPAVIYQAILRGGRSGGFRWRYYEDQY